MASRMIHYVIALNVLKYIEVNNRERFIVGSLVPDACSHEDGSYNVCHFKGYSQDSLRKGINWRAFEEKYGANILDDPLFTGYLCHLIEDAVWFYNVADKYVRKYPRNIREKYYAKGYRDYGRLNGLLVSEYKLIVPHFSEMDIPIGEVPDKYVWSHIGGFLSDFTTDNVCSKDELELYQWDVIKQYIEECTKLCVDELNALREQGMRVDPSQYYVMA